MKPMKSSVAGGFSVMHECACPASRMEIAPNEIHLWLIGLDLAEDSVEHLRRLLSAGERQRERGFHFRADRRRFIVSHGMLRMILGGCVNQRPEEVCFCFEEHGKPYLEPSTNPNGISFNMAHSNELALVGVCRSLRIGVDIEYKDVRHATGEIAHRHFAREELAVFAALSASAQTEAFFTTWTRKEAYIKARGEGVFLGLDGFAIVSDAEARPVLVRSSHQNRSQSWQFRDLSLHEHYAAALAIDGSKSWMIFVREDSGSAVNGKWSYPV
jgi:4'-phosphopantetheinyl transferase